MAVLKLVNFYDFWYS